MGLCPKDHLPRSPPKSRFEPAIWEVDWGVYAFVPASLATKCQPDPVNKN